MSTNRYSRVDLESVVNQHETNLPDEQSIQESKRALREYLWKTVDAVPEISEEQLSIMAASFLLGFTAGYYEPPAPGKTYFANSLFSEN